MSNTYIALDVGERRIGVAQADSAIGIAVPLQTIVVDGTEVHVIQDLLKSTRASVLVVGYPRNQSGETTAQTASVEAFVDRLGPIDAELRYQDESLTSVLAEQQLQATNKPYTKADIDMVAARIILSDYLGEQQ